MALEEGIDLWLGERIGGMNEKEVVSTAAMLTRFYRNVAEPPNVMRAQSKEKPKSKSQQRR
jgi:hypothetical protein